VPANWIACRRCGAALPVGSEDEPRMVMRPASVAAATAVRKRPAATTVAPPPRRHTTAHDTLVPQSSGGRDTLLPPTAKRRTSTPKRPNPRRRRRIVIGVVVIALLVSVRFAWSVAFRPEPIRDAKATAAAVQRLDHTVKVARTFFVRDGAYDLLRVDEFRGKTDDVLVVDAGTNARTGQVSIKGRGDATAILVTPGEGDICVFARDEPMARRTLFATTTGQACRAAEPPETGWKPA
jgi:hypothetical protein